MEFSIRTIFLVVIGLITVLLIIMFAIGGFQQSGDAINSIFDWFKVLGGGA